MDLLRVQEVVNNGLLYSGQFPYRTGYLKDHFFTGSTQTSTQNTLTETILDEPTVKYGRILEVAPTIRYGMKKVGYLYQYKRNKNRHFRYIERIINEEVVGAIESEFGVKKI